MGKGFWGMGIFGARPGGLAYQMIVVCESLFAWALEGTAAPCLYELIVVAPNTVLITPPLTRNVVGLSQLVKDYPQSPIRKGGLEKDMP
jgi:hypothetical protein